MSAPVPLRPTFCEIDLSAIADNVAAIDAHVGDAAVMPVIADEHQQRGLRQVKVGQQAVRHPKLPPRVQEQVGLAAARLQRALHDATMARIDATARRSDG